jgi:hypothetical protein
MREEAEGRTCFVSQAAAWPVLLLRANTSSAGAALRAASSSGPRSPERDCWFVARAAITERLLLRALAGEKQQPDHGWRPVARARWFVKPEPSCYGQSVLERSDLARSRELHSPTLARRLGLIATLLVGELLVAPQQGRIPLDTCIRERRSTRRRHSAPRLSRLRTCICWRAPRARNDHDPSKPTGLRDASGGEYRRSGARGPWRAG